MATYHPLIQEGNSWKSPTAHSCPGRDAGETLGLAEQGRLLDVEKSSRPVNGFYEGAGEARETKALT